MKISVVLIALAAGPSAALAQAEFGSPDFPRMDLVTPPAAVKETAGDGWAWPSERSAVLVQERVGHMRTSLGVVGRASFPGDGRVSDAGLIYSDLFDPGLGISVEGDVMTAIGPGLEVGGYLSGGYDWFGGSKSTDDFGNVIDPHTMRIGTVIGGGKLRGHFGPGFFWEGRLGAGVAHYSSVDATITDVGFPPAREQLFRPTTHGAFEVGARVGWGEPNLLAVFGFAARLMGGPQRGKNISDLINTDTFDTFIIDLGLMVRF